MRHREQQTRAARRRFGVVIGGAVLALGAGTVLPTVANAETCTAGGDDTRCEPSETVSTAQARSEQGFAFSRGTGSTGDGPPVTVELMDDDSRARATAAGRGSLASALADGGSRADTDSRAGGASLATADGDSRARSAAAGQQAVAVTAATDSSRAAAGVDGDRAVSSGAAADHHSLAFSRAVGPGSTARASADDHDRAFALAGPLSSADVAGRTPAGAAHATCSGAAVGLDVRSRASCAGPVSTPPVTSTPFVPGTGHEAREDDDCDDEARDRS